MANYSFGSTGAVQTVTIGQTGTYDIAAYGRQGGNTTVSSEYAPGGAMLLHPSFAPPISAYAAMEDACLPWVVAGPARATGLRQRSGDRAASPRFRPRTS